MKVYLPSQESFPCHVSIGKETDRKVSNFTEFLFSLIVFGFLWERQIRILKNGLIMDECICGWECSGILNIHQILIEAGIIWICNSKNGGK